MVSAGWIEFAGRVLLGERASTRTLYPGVWELPAGHLEEGETGTQALVRELEEELGIHVTALTHQNFQTVETELVSVRVWHIATWKGEIRNASPNEHQNIKWVPLCEVRSLRLGPVISHLIARR